jgi:hypothetical protein
MKNSDRLCRFVGGSRSIQQDERSRREHPERARLEYSCLHIGKLQWRKEKQSEDAE